MLNFFYVHGSSLLGKVQEVLNQMEKDAKHQYWKVIDLVGEMFSWTLKITSLSSFFKQAAILFQLSAHWLSFNSFTKHHSPDKRYSELFPGSGFLLHV